MRWWRRAGGVLSLAVLLFLIYAMFFLTRTEPSLWTQAGALFALIAISYGTADAFNATVTLYEDAIEVQTLFRLKRLPFSGIRGRREWVQRNAEGADTHYLKLVPNDRSLPTLNLMRSYTFDEEFYRWYNSLPNLDQSDPQWMGFLFGRWL
jgi:hypothetical protein